jgi:hypothetical protein
MENITSIISNNPFYLEQLATAPEPIKFDNTGEIPKANNTGKFIVLGLLGIVGAALIYKHYLPKK